MSKSIFVDTGYILALLNSRDKFHKQALMIADNIDVKLITTEAILTEIGNAPTAGRGL